MMEFSAAPLWQNVIAFIAAGLTIGWIGTLLAGLADRLADRTGLGEAMAGAVFLGLITSLPGLAVSVTAAIEGRPALAFSNALGGIAVQTVFLALADLAYRKANLEHAVASVQNMLQIVLLVVLLSVVLLGLSGPDVSVGHVHVVTPTVLALAGLGIFMVYRTGEHPMWRPRDTTETVPDIPDEDAKQEKLSWLVVKFAGAAVVVLIAGIVLSYSTGAIADKTGFSESLAGALLSGVVTSLPELITTIAAVRRGALTLAVGDIVGGNFFDVLFILAVDVAYLQGSVYHASSVGLHEVFLTSLIILLNMILLCGMLYRQTRGPANIGLESVLILAFYLGGAFVLITSFSG